MRKFFKKSLNIVLIFTLLLTSLSLPQIIQAKSDSANKNNEKSNENSNKSEKSNDIPKNNDSSKPQTSPEKVDTNEKKVEICHIPPGNPKNLHTIEISVNAVNTHKDHHLDYEGPCDDGAAPEGSVVIKDSDGNILEYTNNLAGVYVEYIAHDFSNDGRDIAGVRGARFSNDGFNWITISQLPITDKCYSVTNTDNKIEEVESCNEWNGSTFRVNSTDINEEGRYYKYLEVSDGVNTAVVSTSFVYDITPPGNHGFVIIGNNESDESNPPDTSNLKNYVVYRAWDNSNPVTISDADFGSDFYAGVGHVRFSKDSINYDDWIEYSDGILKSYLETWTEDSTFDIYMQVKDRAGNIGTVTFSDSINYSNAYSGDILGESAQVKTALINPCDGARFKDVCRNHTFYSYIENLAADGIVNGYPQGYPQFPNDGIYFGPGNALDRGAMAKFIKNAFNIPTDLSCGNFPDVDSSHTFYIYITSLKCAKIVNGYSDGRYKAGNLVTRGQTTKFVVNAINYKEGINLSEMVDVSNSAFSDVRRSNAFYTQINILANLRVNGQAIISGSGGKYNPDVDINRGAMSKIVDLGRKWEVGNLEDIFAQAEDHYFDGDFTPAEGDWGTIHEFCSGYIKDYSDSDYGYARIIYNIRIQETKLLYGDFADEYFATENYCYNLGLPTSDRMTAATSQYETEGDYQKFDYGDIYGFDPGALSAYEAYAVYRDIFDQHREWGGTNSDAAFGFPIGKAHVNDDPSCPVTSTNKIQEFEGGYIIENNVYKKNFRTMWQVIGDDLIYGSITGPYYWWKDDSITLDLLTLPLQKCTYQLLAERGHNEINDAEFVDKVIEYMINEDYSEGMIVGNSGSTFLGVHAIWELRNRTEYYADHKSVIGLFESGDNGFAEIFRDTCYLEGTANYPNLTPIYGTPYSSNQIYHFAAYPYITYQTTKAFGLNIVKQHEVEAGWGGYEDEDGWHWDNSYMTVEGNGGGNWQDYILGLYGVYLGNEMVWYEDANYYREFIENHIKNNDKTTQLDMLEELKDKEYINDEEFRFLRDRVSNIECSIR